VSGQVATAYSRESHFIQNVWYKGAWGDEFLFAIFGSEWR